MGCCGNKSKPGTFYSQRYESPETSYRKTEAPSSRNKKPKCNISYKDLSQLFMRVDSTTFPVEEKNAIRLQIAEWINVIYSVCPDEAKYNVLKEKIDGSNPVQD